MPRVPAFRSKLPGTEVYHDQLGCTVGSNIESHNRVQGMGGLRRCSECARLG